MRYVFWFVFGCLLLSEQVMRGQDQPMPVSMIQLIANPQKFDAKLVTVHAFLTLEHEKHHAPIAFLYLHEEDAKHLLGSNAAEVVPSEQMLRDAEKIDGMYVTITGLFRVVPGASASHGMVIKEVRSCLAWSDPRRPVGSRRENEIQDTQKK